uniref:Uncharacterized protein n=1 Tax=Anguilla anguilla TaxID=7936 RepID=A0A0E9TZZ1_ANGAN
MCVQQQTLRQNRMSTEQFKCSYYRISSYGRTYCKYIVLNCY